MKLTVISKCHVPSSIPDKDRHGKTLGETKGITDYNVFLPPDPDRDPELHPELLVGEKQDEAEPYKFYLKDDETEEVFNYKLPRKLIESIRNPPKDTKGNIPKWWVDNYNVYLVIKKGD